MIPILYEHGETSFTTNGICRLPDCVSCKVTEVINGLYECVFEYPMTGKHYDQIIEDRIIYTTHDDGKIPQPFDIYKRTAPMNGVVTFYAKHISYRLNKVILEPYTATTSLTAVSGIADHSINHNAFTFSTSITSTEKFQLVFPASVRNALGADDNSILSTYGGEVEWNKFNVAITSRRGMDRDVQLRYGKNLEDIRYDSDITETYNAIVPYWKSSDGKMLKTLPEKIIYLENVNNGEYDHLISEDDLFSDGENTTSEEIFTDEDEEINFTDITSETKAVVIDLSSDFDDVPSDARLREVAIQRFNESLVPLTNIEVRFFELWNTVEYEKYASLQRVFLGDTVGVIYTDLGVNTSKRVVKVVYDSLLERYESMELGTVQKSFGTTVAARVKQEIMKIAPTIDIMAEAIDHGTELLRGGLGGHLVINVNAEGQPNEILLMDTDSIETAVHVLRINLNGIGFSSTGYNGEYTTGWTLDGVFYADFITAGTLTANVIKAGILAPIVGHSFLNMLTGEFKFGDELSDYISFVNDPDGHKFLDIKANSISLQGNGVATGADITTALSDYDPTSVLDQQELFNILTNNSQQQGLWLVDGHLLLNFEYAKGQTLELGGANNGNGLLTVYNSSGQLVGEISQEGFKSSTSDWFDSFYTRYKEGVLACYYKKNGYEYRVGQYSFENINNQEHAVRILNENSEATYITYYYRASNSFDDIAVFSNNSIKLNKDITNYVKFKAGLNSTEIVSDGAITVNAGGIFVKGGWVDISSSVNNISLFATGLIYGSNISSSDRRLKKNIKPSNANIIDQLKVVQFDWKKDDSHVSAGLIAQDVQGLCPELVSEGKDGMLGLCYEGLVPHLIKKVQEQQKEIGNLKKEIAEIKALLKGVA